MIRFGPSGIPLSCKGRTLRDGIEDVHNLGLSAMEVQLVRVNLNERYATDEDIDHTIHDLPGELVVRIGRPEERKMTFISDFHTKIERGDVLYPLASGVARDYEELEELGRIAKQLDIQMSLHAPYYMDLADVDGLAEKSRDAILWGSLLAHAVQGTTVVAHLGRYGGLAPTEALEKIRENLSIVRQRMDAAKLSPMLGLEASGLQEVVGSLDEILYLGNSIKGVVPVLNFAHLHAREGGILRRPEDFARILEKAQRFANGPFHAHFSGVEHAGGNEIRYTPIKKGDLRFEPLAECLLGDSYDITLISSSPLLEHDAMYMRVIFDRVLAKKSARPVEPERPPERLLLPTAKPVAKPAPKPAGKRAAKKPSQRPAARKRKPEPKRRPKSRPAKLRKTAKPKRKSARRRR